MGTMVIVDIVLTQHRYPRKKLKTQAKKQLKKGGGEACRFLVWYLA